MNKYELDILERLSLLNILPKEGNYITLKVIRDLQDDLSFTEKELKDCKIEDNRGQITWDSSKNKPVKKEIGEKASELIQEELKKLNEQNKLTQGLYSLYEKFVESKR